MVWHPACGKNFKGKALVAEEKGEERVCEKEERMKRKKKGERITWEKKESGKN